MVDTRTAIALASARKRVKREMIVRHEEHIKHYLRIHKLIHEGSLGQALNFIMMCIDIAENDVEDLQPKPKRKRDYSTCKSNK